MLDSVREVGVVFQSAVANRRRESAYRTMDKGQADAKVNGFSTRTISSRTTVCGTMISSKPFIFGGMEKPFPLAPFYAYYSKADSPKATRCGRSKCVRLHDHINAGFLHSMLVHDE